MSTWGYLTISMRYQWLPEEECYHVWHYFLDEEPGTAHEEYREEDMFSHGQMARFVHCCLHIAAECGLELVSLPALRDDGEAYFLIIPFKYTVGMQAPAVEC